MTQARIPIEFPLVALDHLIVNGTAAADRRNALAVLYLIVSSLAPRSYTSTMPVDMMMGLLGLNADEIVRAMQLLAAVHAITLFRNRQKIQVSVTPSAVGAHLAQPDLVVRRRLDDALEAVFNRACISNNLGAAADILTLMEKWHNDWTKHGGTQRRRKFDPLIRAMRDELDRRLSAWNQQNQEEASESIDAQDHLPSAAIPLVPRISFGKQT